MPDYFLIELDGMIESTDEFIADDKVTVHDDPEHRLVDALCLNHVRGLYIDVFQRDEPMAEDEHPALVTLGQLITHTTEIAENEPDAATKAKHVRMLEEFQMTYAMLNCSLQHSGAVIKKENS